MAAVSTLGTQLRRWRLTFGVHAGIKRGNVVLAPRLPYYRNHRLLMHLPAVVDLRQDCSQVDEVLPWVSHHRKSLPRRLRILSLVACRRRFHTHILPFEQTQSRIFREWTNITQLCHWSILSIEKGVAQHQLLAFQVPVSLSYLVPFRSLWAKLPHFQPVFVIAQLLDEGSSNFQIRPP